MNAFRGSLRRAATRGLAVAALAAPLLLTPPAAADRYEVWSCRGPDGAPTPVRDGSGGWESRSVNSDTVTGTNLLRDSCVDGGALEIDHVRTGSQASGTRSDWRFRVPVDTEIASHQTVISGRLRGTRPSQGSARGTLLVGQEIPGGEIREFLRLTGGVASHLGPGDVEVETRVVEGPSAAGASDLFVGIGCAGEPLDRCYAGDDGSAGELSISQSRITLVDRHPPVVTSVQGDAVSATVWPRSGVGLSLAVTDRGGGVLRVGVEVDGGEPRWHAVAAAPCTVLPGTVRGFAVPRPCPTAVGVDVAIPTADWGEGPHALRVLVEDAAGNQTTAYGPVTKRISAQVGPGGDAVGGPDGSPPGRVNAADPGNSGALASPSLGGPGPVAVDPGPPNGSPAPATARIAARWEGSSSRLRRARYGERPTLTGQLTTTDGLPVRGAAVRVRVTPEHRGARVEHHALTTDDRGRFRWRMPTGVGSRRIELRYHRHVGDATPVASTAVRLEVAAAVRMTLDRSVARQGQSVRLAGRLVGRPLPRVGSVVELQARNPGRKWITFRTIRADRHGRFASRYRFRMPGPATFQMRARVRKAGDYPYATGVSPHRTIRVR